MFRRPWIDELQQCQDDQYNRVMGQFSVAQRNLFVDAGHDAVDDAHRTDLQRRIHPGGIQPLTQGILAPEIPQRPPRDRFQVLLNLHNDRRPYTGSLHSSDTHPAISSDSSDDVPPLESPAESYQGSEEEESQESTVATAVGTDVPEHQSPNDEADLGSDHEETVLVMTWDYATNQYREMSDEETRRAHGNMPAHPQSSWLAHNPEWRAPVGRVPVNENNWQDWRPTDPPGVHPFRRPHTPLDHTSFDEPQSQTQWSYEEREMPAPKRQRTTAAWTRTHRGSRGGRLPETEERRKVHRQGILAQALLRQCACPPWEPHSVQCSELEVSQSQPLALIQELANLQTILRHEDFASTTATTKTSHA
jgi:hypothetical protein